MNLLMILVSFCLISYANGQIQNISEQILYTGYQQGDKSFNFYTLTVSSRFYTGAQHLAFKVIARDYDSDPDIFISKNVTNPRSSIESRWYCMKVGSDTCVVRNSDIKIGDIFYIGVRCINDCTYDLRAYFVTVVSLKENTRTQLRLDGQSTNIFEYYVPPDSTDGFTTSVILSVESENPYAPLDLYLSTDDDLYQIEEKKQAELMDNGKLYRFTENDASWCTRCFIYLLLDIEEGGRYYVTGRAFSRNSVQTNNKATTLVANIRTQECYQYFIDKQENDLQILVNQYQGNAQVYIANRDVPTSLNDPNVRFISDMDSWRGLIISSQDRLRYGQQIGLYYVCIFAFTDVSLKLLINEANYNKRFDAVNDMLYTYNIESNGYIYFRYTTQNFVSRTTINIQLNAFNLNLTAKNEPAKIYYKVCSSQTPTDCYLEVAEAQGKSAVMQEVGVIVKGTSRVGQIYHNPSVCPNVNSCYYLISTFNSISNLVQKVSFKITNDNEDPQDAVLDTAYRNIKKPGSYEYYELLPGSSVGFPYTDAIVIDCKAYTGDADLYMSFTNKFPNMNNYEFSSNEIGDTPEQIILNRTNIFSLNRPIYISVYAFTQVAYELRISAVYSPTFNEKLEKAEPLTDSVANYKYFENESQEAFYSFIPWWSGRENRTMVYYADIIFNQVFFYLEQDEYPFFYLTQYQDQDDIIVVRPQDNKYNLYSQYYIRLRPDFALYDLISKRQYIFNFFAFAQLPDRYFTELQLNETVMGYANRTVKYYRHMIMFKNLTYQINVTPLSGNPQLLIRVSNESSYPVSTDILSYDVRQDAAGKTPEILNVTLEQRIRYNLNCDRSGYQLYGGQKTYCDFYIGVECAIGCVYNITITLTNVTNAIIPSSIPPPRYLIENEYQSGKTEFNKYTYFYFPIHRTLTGDFALLVNKTAPLNQNGDSMVVAWLQNDTTLPYDKWTYPTISKYHVLSYTNSTNQPELFEICGQTFQERCVNASCAVIVGVMGIQRNTTSSFRLKAFTSKNRLYNQVPVSGTISKAGRFAYYWFVNNATVINQNATWEHVIAVSPSSQSADVDLFVTAFDGRMPVDTDYDWVSNNIGPDDVFINNTDKFLEFRNFNTSNGILFVVGVKALSDNASYSLIMSGPQKFKVSFVDLQTGVPITRTFRNFSNSSSALASTNYEIYKWFNWGHRDFRVQVDALEGSVYMYFNYMTEETFLNDGYLAVPRNINNSRYSEFINVTDSRNLRVFKTDIGDGGFFCYYCWYYVTVMSNYTKGNSTYRIAVSESADAGDDMTQLVIGEPSSLQLPGTGSVMQRKFLLDTKQPFTISLTLATGYVIVYVGLYPDTPLTRYAWKAEGGVGTITIRVRTTDPNFRLGTFYYVTMQATSGRASISLRINQNVETTQLETGIIFKDLFWTMEERVKLYYFKTPKSNFTAVIKIDALTEDFYPTIYLNQNALLSAPQDFRTLTYPTIKSYGLKFGDNFCDLVNTDTFTFTFKDQATTDQTYYSMAVYSYSYGLTDRRKAEFKISVQVFNTSTNGTNLTVSYNDQVNMNLIDDLSAKEHNNNQVHFLPQQNEQDQQQNYLDYLNKWFETQYESLNEKFSNAISYFSSN